MKSPQSAILGLLLLILPAAVQAQFNYITNSDGISLTLTGYSGSGGEVIIPASINGFPVTGIGEEAFEFCYSMTNATIPDSVTNIGEKAFQYCSSLTSMTIPDSVINIEEQAFEFCTSMTNATIPDSVMNIGEEAFEGCMSLTNVTIPDSVTNIGEEAFQFCGSLTSMTIPNSVIGTSAFFGDGSLTNVFLGNIVSSLEQGTFASCRLTSVTILMGASSIAEGAFEGYPTPNQRDHCRQRHEHRGEGVPVLQQSDQHDDS